MEEDKIKYSDIIQPDDSLEKLISQLGEINRQYETMTNAIRTGADRIVYALKKASGATSEGRKSIEEATEATSRLERAQRELDLAMSETGKEIARLKAQTRDANRATVEGMRSDKQKETSLDKLKSKLKESVTRFKALTETEVAEAEMGQKLIADILALKDAIKKRTAEIKPQVEELTRLQKAEKELAYWLSEEGQQELDVKAKITEVTSARRKQKTGADSLEKAQKKLAYANSEEYRTLVLANKEAKEAEKLKRLEAIATQGTGDSYEELSAQYAANVIKINKMSVAERQAAKGKEGLITRTKELRDRLNQMQEEVGNHTLSVGNYRKAWDGVYFSTQQIVRELPTAAVSLNHLFLAVSNNIPVLIDNIQRLNAVNKAAVKNGHKAKSVIGTITSSLFSWQTALIIGITILSTHGEAIVNWIGDLFSGERATLSAAKAAKLLNEELKNQSDEYGKNIATFKKLAKSWKELPVDERIEAVDAYAEALEDLGLKAKDLNSIEELFNSNTLNIQNAFKARARAAAAMALAEKKYAEAFELEEKLRTGDTSFWEDILIGTGDLPDLSYYFEGGWLWGRPKVTGESIKKSIEEANQAAVDKALAQGNQYFQISDSYTQEAQEWLGAFALEDPTSGGKSLDLLQRLANQRLKILEKYEKSATRLKESSVEERAGKEIDARRAENEQLKSLYAQNTQLLMANSKAEQGEFTLRGKKHKALTEAQVAEVQDSNAKILEIITNNNNAIEKEQHELELKLQNQSLEAQQKTVNLRLDTVKKGTEEELRLRLQALDIARKQALVNNALADPSARVAAADINKSFEAKRLLLLGEAKLEAFEQTQDLAAAEFNTVKRTSEEITAFEIQQEIDLWNMKISLAKQGMLKWGDAQIAEAEAFLKKLGIEQVDNAIETQQSVLEIQQKTIDLQLKAVKKGSEEERNLRLQALENERKLALLANSLLPESQRQSEDVINSAFMAEQLLLLGELDLTAFEERQKTEEESFNATKHTEREKTIFMLQQERDRWKYLITLAEQGSLQWSDEQIKAAKAAVKGIDNELGDITGVKGVIGDIADKGLGGTLLSRLGFDDEAIQAFNEATDTIISNLQSIMEAEIQLAEAAVEAAQERADSAKSALDAEIEARSKGYANNVATARKEYEQEKKRVADQQKLLQQAKRRQEALDTAMQTSSLITASANIWKSMSEVPVVGPALALAAIASMWASFAVSKVKARQVTAAESQQYGEGGLEFLEGGSHASGNDIDLATKNRRGRNMRAEGGEALAIINKRNTKRYRKQLPGIIESLNRGTFEDKYLNAFDAGENVMLSIASTQKAVDLTKLESYTEKISKQGEVQRFNLLNGSILVVNKNVRRIIKP